MTRPDVPPAHESRLSRWTERARILRERSEAARTSHATVDFGFTLAERDAAIGGGLLAGALAYRLFVVLLPTTVLFVSGLGLYADTVNESPGKVASEAGLRGLIASQVAESASSKAGWLVFLLMVPAVLYAITKLFRATAVVHAIVWHGSGRGARTTPMGVGVFGAAFLISLVGADITVWISRHSGLGGLGSLLAYLVLVGGAWLAASLQLPHGDARWQRLLPGAGLFGAGLLFVNVFNLYVTTWLVEDRANTYGALGIAAALLFSLVLVGRLIVVSAELNASLDDRRRPDSTGLWQA